jgi:cytidylate kinase
MNNPISVSHNIRPILASIQAVHVPPQPIGQAQAAPQPPPPPFITISRQPGAGAWRLAQQFVDAVNASDPDGPRLTCLDRVLVEKVAADHHLSERLIESLEQADHSWITDLFSGLSLAEHTEDTTVYRRVVQTIRALAQAGHVVIVGRGAAFATRNLDGGVHLRLVAPREHRVGLISQSMNLTHQAAEAWVRERERGRATFYKRFWPNDSLEPESFTVTANAARISPSTMIAMLAALVKDRAVTGVTS